MAKNRRLTDFTNVDVLVEGEDSGGYGLVYFGHDRRSGQQVALKTLKSHVLKNNPPARALFTKEALTWLSLWPHPNVIPALSVTEIDDLVFIVLPYARRGSLGQQLNTGRRIGPFGLARHAHPLGQRLLWAQMIAAGLDSLHTPDTSMLRDFPIVHRDLKPDNILIQQNGLAQITDLGLAKVVETYLDATNTSMMDVDSGDYMHSQPWRTPQGMSFAAVPYRAPEQWEGNAPIDTYTDMYAFGIILSELIAGRHPFVNLHKVPKNFSWREAHLHQAPRPLTDGDGQLPDALSLVYDKCLAKDPAARPSAREALRLLQVAARALGHRPYEIPEILAHTPENEAKVWQNLSAVYAQFKYFEQALDWNDWTLKRNPDSRTALLARANILSQISGVDEAVQAYNRVLSITPSTDHIFLNTIYTNYGDMLSRAQRFPESEAVFAKAADAMPDAADTWNNRGANQMAWALQEAENQHREEALHHLELAINYAHRAKGLNKRDPHYERTLAEFEKLRNRIMSMLI